MVRQFVPLTGYTQEELEHAFAEEITSISAERSITEAELLSQIRHWYNGYRWAGPVSLLQSLFPFSTFLLPEPFTTIGGKQVRQLF